VNPGWIVPDRLIFDALMAGLVEIDAAFTANTIDRLLERMFNSFDGPARAQVREWLRANEVRLLLNFPQTDAEIPCLAVVVDPDEQSAQYVGDLGGRVQLDSGEIVNAQTSRWRTTVGVIAYAEKSDVVLWLNHIAKFLLSAKRKELFDHFVHGQTLRGRDLGFDQRFAPRFVYRRVVALTAEYDQTDAVEEGAAAITSVSSAPEVVSGVV